VTGATPRGGIPQLGTADLGRFLPSCGRTNKRASPWKRDADFVLSFVLKQRLPMSTSTAADQADRIIGALRAHETELRRAGIRSLSLFGSFARGEAEAASDIDLAAEFDPAVRMDLFRLTALERRIAEILGRRVDLLPEPAEKPRLRANIDRDRRRAF
jgi:uncharacterized protein